MSPTPAGSGKSARPVPGRTRDTDHRQRSCRAASAGAVKRGARRHLLSPAKQNPKTTHTKPNKTPKQDK
ncbi:hypothetical protein ACRW63_24530 [Escherichia coli]|uniref:hypothetical protein n=1 Tax=Enterobacteriaceae TaxID=543 RepID=UPI00278C8EC0|nr:hypothetical protein [Escherichia coli]MDW6080811.1 hypothetical protein [Escherichia coli]MDW6294556.1 hypothetical protein [Escherichia coli]MDZ7036954.1 hypothetical protein [Escherichia coli]MDZ9928119.1 hypothetical protein [Escherichia coli]WOR71937.1 hypothetical protein R4V96_24075 [Escherichia coli]